MRARVIVKAGRAKPLYGGHPFLFADSVGGIEHGPPQDVVEVVDDRGTFIGLGLYSGNSVVRVRVLAGTRAGESVEDFINERISEAYAVRCATLRDASAPDAMFRVVNSEGDHLPGLVVDRYGNVAAVQFTTKPMKAMQEMVFAAVQRALKPLRIDEVAAGSFAGVEGFQSESRVVYGPRDSRVVQCSEHDVRYEIDLADVQKTGAFLDQRDNRQLFGRVAGRAKRVADVCCYHGGFGLNAARAGAAEVAFVDASEKALECVRRNLTLNGLASDAHTIVRADCFMFLKSAAAQPAFDVINLDPPKFAGSRADGAVAAKGLLKLNTLAAAALQKSGGYLFSHSCSHAMRDTFAAIVLRAVRESGRTARVLEVRTQGSDHPFVHDEGRYLSSALLYIR